MSMEELKANKLTEEEMGDVAGGQASGSAGKAYTYVVKKGDCLSVIAEKLGVKMAKLIDWNVDRYPNLRKNPDYIQAGWTLKYYK